MKKVSVAERGYDYEGFVILGVFGDRKKALRNLNYRTKEIDTTR